MLGTYIDLGFVKQELKLLIIFFHEVRGKLDEDLDLESVENGQGFVMGFIKTPSTPSKSK